MRRWKKVIGVPVAVALLALTGCSQHENTQTQSAKVQVLGEFGAPVTVKIEGTFDLKNLRESVLKKGDGKALTSNGPVLARITSFDSRTSAPIKQYETGKVHLTKLNTENFKTISSYLEGKHEGSRLMFERPGLTKGDNSAVEIMVVDLLHTTLQGKPVAPKHVPKGMPTITQPQEGKGPVAVTVAGGEIPALEAITLIQGSGEQLNKDDTIAMNYQLFTSAGNMTLSNWDKGPVSARLKDLMPGILTGLSDQKVGSRVVILIPSTQAQGNGDVVAVIDILAVLDNSTLNGHD
ncbi:FKBP-type peptidyl-prolyl cis-trans isomerase [Actinotignum urinale]|uniref:FKBP-type peptidyl-prolyl cis-trans isomerase n=1 Tax=Actinotignum urinale TaxID=190146 RepID=UPI00280A6BB3|nr:hypothetical protein [Actinotignum urinale]